MKPLRQRPVRAASARVSLEPVQAPAPVRAWRHVRPGKRLIVSFSPVAAPGGQAGPHMVRFLSTIGDDPLLFLADESESFLNTPGVAETMVALIEAEAARLGVDQILATGNSLGAFSALSIGRLTAIDRVFAMAPRFSIDPDIVPAEEPYFTARSVARPLRFPDLSGLPPAGRETVILLGGGHPREIAHARLFDTGPRQSVIILPDTEHFVMRYLDGLGLVRPVLADALAGNYARLNKRLEKLGACSRDDFLAALNEPSSKRTSP